MLWLHHPLKALEPSNCIHIFCIQMLDKAGKRAQAKYTCSYAFWAEDVTHYFCSYIVSENWWHGLIYIEIDKEIFDSVPEEENIALPLSNIQ